MIHKLRMEHKLGLRRLGIRDAQEPIRATYADPSEGCIIKPYFWGGTTDVAEPTVCSLLLYYEGFKRRSEGEECLVSEQDNERAKYTHFPAPGVMRPHQGAPVLTLYPVDLA